MTHQLHRFATTTCKRPDPGNQSMPAKTATNVRRAASAASSGSGGLVGGRARRRRRRSGHG